MNWLAVGMLFIFVGMFIIIAGSLLETVKGDVKVEGAGVVMIGPIPLVWGTNTRLIIPVLLLVLFIMLLWFFIRH